MSAKTLVIAEPGCTHEGSFETMLRLLYAAWACGANVFKPQWTSDPDQMIARRQVPAEKYRRCYSWLQFPLEWHQALSGRCHQLGMEYACTAFLPQDVDALAPFVDYLKIASFENCDGEMRAARDAACADLRLIVSYGMVTEMPILGWDYALHCVSAYPAPLSEMNLRVLSGNGKIDGERSFDGLSDHSRHLLTGAVAVGAGAEIVEAHFRLDDCDPLNPDYAVAFSPAEFRQYIQNIRDAEVMLGDGVKRVMPCEQAMSQYRVRS